MGFFSPDGAEKRQRVKVYFAHVAQLAEHVLGKDEVTGSSPVMGSRLDRKSTRLNSSHIPLSRMPSSA